MDLKVICHITVVLTIPVSYCFKLKEEVLPGLMLTTECWGLLMSEHWAIPVSSMDSFCPWDYLPKMARTGLG